MSEKKHIVTVIKPQWPQPREGVCGDCRVSCQSACKTSCTVGNQECPLVEKNS